MSTNSNITNADLAAGIHALIEGQATTNRLLGRLVGVEPTPELAAESAAEPAKPERKARKAAKRKAAKRKAEREAFLAARRAAKASNAERAAWLRSIGVVPTGQAWTAAKAGETDPATLRALNAADGITATRTAVVATDDTQAPAKSSTRSSRRAEAARKAAEGKPRNADGTFAKAGEPDLKARLKAAGLSATEIAAALAERERLG